ncbi:MAG: 16S rRNA (uracil(1498)-N(3))-methyltransferase [Bacteroidia bacterium]
MHIFYTPDLSTDYFTLDEDESRHCNKVLRLGLGDVVHLIDGKGGLYEAEISAIGKKNVQLKVIRKQSEFGKRNHYLHIAIAPTKNIDRFEWFLEKATEIGIDEITPLICERSERKTINELRLDKVITSATKQSLTAYHPKLNPATAFSEMVKKEFSGARLIAHCLEDSAKNFVDQMVSQHQSCLIFIGPEGDFSRRELDSALQNGFKPVTLGKTRLRTETAGLAACFEVNYVNR